MNKTQILLKRKRMLPVGKGKSGSFNPAFLTQLAQLGYRVDRPDMINNSLMPDCANILRTLSEMKGADVEYVPLFPDFPDSVPELTDEELESIADSKLSNPVSTDYLRGRVSSVFQDPEEHEIGLMDQQQREGDSHSELITLQVIPKEDVDHELQKWFQSCMYSKSAIKSQLEPDLRWIIANIQPYLDVSKVVFKENLRFIYVYIWSTMGGKEQMKALQSTCKSPSDLLRLFASVTGTDVSLAEDIRFPKFDRPQRRLVMDLLDGYNNPAEDLDRYRDLWLAVGEYLHPGDYKDQYSDVYEAFELLRKNEVRSFMSYFDEHLEERNTDKLFKLLRSRPTVFARKLNQLLRQEGVLPNKTLSEFSVIADQVPLKILINLHRYFQGINEAETRPIVNKNGFMYVMENDQEDLPDELVNRIVDVLEAAIVSKTNRMGVFEEGTKVWVDPELENYLVPLQQRHMSEGLINVARGSRISLGSSEDMSPDLSEKKVLRMFMWWKDAPERVTDLDLSMLVLGAGLETVLQVSFTNLKESGIIHSGDLRSAPKGATEFIDVDTEKLLDKHPNARYLVPAIYVYNGLTFDKIKAHAGWMLRKEVSSEVSSFDPKTVKHKFDLHRDDRYSLPFTFDLQESELIYLDLYAKGRSNFNRVENTETSIRRYVQGLLEYKLLKPNLKDLVRFHVEGSGAKLTEEEADVLIGVRGCDYNAYQPEKILSELL